MSSALASPKLRKRSEGTGTSAAAPTAGSPGGGDGDFRLSKLVDRDHDWDRDELGDILHWIRQILGLLCGLIWGLIPLTGGLWFFVFFGGSTALVYLYYSVLLKVDEEELGGHAALLQEGFMSSMGLFMLTWTLVYSLVHF